ncbi:hypothetical protein GCM10010197_38160 [Nocardioides luteus]|uniref:Uncharacterized protein n=2 Tax=Nocardioides luteus TaxID=1844 RepID=A0ABQ5SVX9_9ACTN|nr:hypothetical protein GCM10010197_38160 [Nocardioides luteus]GLJ68124.1 hypothetical protein GCM10017579_21600 [Nocardioides luteus]
MLRAVDSILAMTEVAGTVSRGGARMHDPRVWGTTIGAVGATVFVHANRGLLDGAWPTVAAVAWVLALAAYVWTVFVVPRRFAAPEPVGPLAGLVYLGGIVFMLVGIFLGRKLLAAQGLEGAEGAVIAFFVGAHFLPYARAFHAPLFTTIGVTLMAIGAAGVVLAAVWSVTAGAAAAVVAGLAMLAIISADAWRTRAAVAQRESAAA